MIYRSTEHIVHGGSAAVNRGADFAIRWTKHRGTVKHMLKRVWKDPVWSKVIATVITASAAGLLALAFTQKLTAVALIDGVWQFLSSTSLPNCIVTASCIAATACLLIVYKEKKTNRQNMHISSNDWFRGIQEKLSDCGYARIYLRSFDHPDSFRDEHRDALMNVMNILKDKIISGADIRIISFNPTGNKSGFDWLCAEIKNDHAVCSAIKILAAQPVANSTSMYLFDDKYVIFNKRINGRTSYHIENYSNSIVHEFIRRGFDDFERTQ